MMGFLSAIDGPAVGIDATPTTGYPGIPY